MSLSLCVCVCANDQSPTKVVTSLGIYAVTIVFGHISIDMCHGIFFLFVYLVFSIFKNGSLEQ